MTNVTQTDIARQLGLSQRAVGYALANDIAGHQKLNPETRELIVQTAQQMGYVPHHAARRLARARAASQATGFDQVGLIYLCENRPSSFDPVSLWIIAGAERELYTSRAFVTFVRVQEAADWDKVDMLIRAGNVDGWLLYGGEVTDEILARLELPCVVLGDHHCTHPMNNVNIDNRLLGRMAAQHLAALGHRRVAVVGSEPLFPYQRQTRAGFLAAAAELSLEVQEPRFFWSYTDIKPAQDWFLNAHSRPTGIFTPEFDWAEPLARALNQVGVQVPEEVSVLACESETDPARSHNFTRFNISMQELGQRGAALLQRVVTSRESIPTQIKISPALIQGWSTCPPRAGASDGSTAAIGNPRPLADHERRVQRT